MNLQAVRCYLAENFITEIPRENVSKHMKLLATVLAGITAGYCALVVLVLQAPETTTTVNKALILCAITLVYAFFVLVLGRDLYALVRYWRTHRNVTYLSDHVRQVRTAPKGTHSKSADIVVFPAHPPHPIEHTNHSA